MRQQVVDGQDNDKAYVLPDGNINTVIEEAFVNPKHTARLRQG